MKRVREIMSENQQAVVERAALSIAARRRTRKNNVQKGLPELLSALIAGLESDSKGTSFVQAAAHGILRRQQGCSIDDLFEDFRALERAVYEIVQENLLAADVSNLVPDLRAFNDHVQDVLRHAINAYLAHTAVA